MLSVKNRGTASKSLDYLSLSMISAPTKKQYAVGEPITYSGLLLYAYYSMNFTRDVTNIAVPSIAEGTLATTDMSEITFTYADGGTSYSVSYEIVVSSHVLPEGYTALQYIYNQGSRSLDTGIPWGTNQTIEIDFVMDGASANVNRTIVGANQYYSNRYYCGYVRANYNNWSMVDIAAIVNNTTYSKTVTSTSVLNGRRYLMSIDCKNSILTLIDKDTGNSQAFTVDSIAHFNDLATYNIFVAPMITGTSYFKLYGLSVYSESGLETHALQPCVNPSNVVGLYDYDTKQFINGNSWTRPT